jgi:hypothetical protein
MVDINYRCTYKQSTSMICPLAMDLFNLNPNLGWASIEQSSIGDRGLFYLVMALALIHHFKISNSYPFRRLAAFFAKIGTWLIIEFIQKDDRQMQKLFKSRKDILDYYTLVTSINNFSSYYAPVIFCTIP